jgi:hypothetical protein
MRCRPKPSFSFSQTGNARKEDMLFRRAILTGQEGKREGQEGKREGQEGRREGQEGRREGQEGRREGQEGRREGQEGKREGQGPDESAAEDWVDHMLWMLCGYP